MSLYIITVLKFDLGLHVALENNLLTLILLERFLFILIEEITITIEITLAQKLLLFFF